MTVSRLIKDKFPKLYSLLVTGVNYILNVGTPYSIYITDSLGGSFKNYLLVNNMPDKIEKLKYNLDPESIKLIDTLLQRFLYYPDEQFKTKMSKKDAIVGGLLPIETPEQKAKIENTLKSISGISVPIEESVFYFYHGLTLLPNGTEQYIKNQHFIDVGAFIGDSAIALVKYNYSKIYSIEISRKSIDQYKINLSKHNIPEEKYNIYNLGVAATDNEEPVELNDTGSAGLSLYRKKGKYDAIKVEKRTIDWVVNQNQIKPKFIKVDIEGAGLDFVNGAFHTLTQFRPILSIAIYHNPKEFFEIKPVLERILTNYTFLIQKLSSGVRNNLIHSEVVLLAYPNEITTAEG